MRIGGWRVAISSLISVEWHGILPRLVVHEKYETVIKWTLRGLTLLAILSSLISLTKYQSLFLAIVLTALEQFLERAVFQYTSMYVQPMPDFAFDPARWTGMGFAFPQRLEPGVLNLVGPAFDDEATARGFLRLLKAWNYNQDDDKNDNICLSFIVENDREYSAYLYP